MSAIFGADEFDTGDIIAQSRSIHQLSTEDQRSDFDRKQDYLDCAAIVLRTLFEGKRSTAVSQDESLASHSVWRDELDYAIDWSKSFFRDSSID